MKTYGTLLAIGLLAAFQAAAAPQPQPSQNPSAYNKVEKDFPWLNSQSTSAEKNKIERYGNMSSQPWTEIVGWHPGTSQFPDAENYESQLILFQTGGPQK
jgi:hypothetical protein